MRIHLMSLALVVLAGCSRSGGETAFRTYPEARHEAEAEQAVEEAAPEPAADPALAEEAARLAEQLNDPDPYVRAEAAGALAGNEQGFPHLLEGLRASSWEVRLLCLQALDRTMLTEHTTEALPAVQQLLRDSNPQLRQQAIYRLAWFGEPARASLGQLENLAGQDPSADVRSAAADAVVELNATPGRLQTLLQNRNPLIRLRAVRALGGLGAEARDQLGLVQNVAAGDPDPAIRQAAGQAYQAIRRTLR